MKAVTEGLLNWLADTCTWIFGCPPWQKLWVGFIGIALLAGLKAICSDSLSRHTWQQVGQLAYCFCVDLVVLGFYEQYSKDYRCTLEVIGIILAVAAVKGLWQVCFSDTDSDNQQWDKVQGMQDAASEDFGFGGLCVERRRRRPSETEDTFAEMEDGTAASWASVCGMSRSAMPIESQPVMCPPQLTPKPKTYIASNIFQDFDKSAVLMAMVFVGQLLLWWFYVFSLQIKAPEIFIVPAEEDNAVGVKGRLRYAYWFTAVVAVQMGSLLVTDHEGQLGSGYEGWLWWSKIRSASINTYTDELVELQVPSWKRLLCQLFSFVSNGMLRQVVLFTVPIFLMQESDPIDVVKDALAVTFLVKLDDIAGKRYVLVFFPDRGMSVTCGACGGLDVDEETFSSKVLLQESVEKKREVAFKLTAAGTLQADSSTRVYRYDEELEALRKEVAELKERRWW
mmetsp:Transcript_46620/g.107690  ORF Transcript_46620/g.107690 Transcript_46620/m.107690 type:complete len:452 (+) Transcript_46620:92-1447(+)